jgi:hypothetical protein
MKRLLTLFFAGVLVIAFTLPVQAAGSYLGAPDFKFRMWLMNQGRNDDNVFDFEDERHDAHRHVYQRFRWWLDTSFEGKYGGTIGFQYDWIYGRDAYSASKGGSPGLIGTAFAPTVSLGSGGHGGRWGVQGDRTGGITVPSGDMAVQDAYVWGFIPGTEVKMTLGLQGPIWDPDGFMFGTIGRYWGIRLDTPLIKGMLNLSAMWIKHDEGSPGPTEDSWHGSGFGGGPDRDSEDVDMLGVRISGTPLADWLDLGTYHWWAHVGGNGLLFMADRIPDFPDAMLGRQGYAGLEGDYFWHGFTASGTPWDMIYARVHLNYWHGSPDRSVNQVTGLVTEQDDDPDGFAVFGRAGVDVGGGLRVGIRGWYFSGNDDDWVDYENVASSGAATGDPDYGGWTAPDTYFWSGFELFYSGPRGWGTWDYQYSVAPRGTWAICLESDWQVTKRLLLDLLAGGIWYTDENDKHRTTMLNAAGAANFAAGNPAGAGNFNDEKFAGFEIDLRATYKVYDNLTLDLIGAYFITGDAMDSANQDVADDFWKADDAYELFWRLVYSF